MRASRTPSITSAVERWVPAPRIRRTTSDRYRYGSSSSPPALSDSQTSSKYAGAWLPAPYPDWLDSLKYEYGISVSLLDRRRKRFSSPSVMAGRSGPSTGAWNAPTTATTCCGFTPSARTSLIRRRMNASRTRFSARQTGGSGSSRRAWPRAYAADR